MVVEGECKLNNGCLGKHTLQVMANGYGSNLVLDLRDVLGEDEGPVAFWRRGRSVGGGRGLGVLAGGDLSPGLLGFGRWSLLLDCLIGHIGSMYVLRSSGLPSDY